MADIREVLATYDNSGVYDESGTECESFAGGMEQAAEIILNAQTNGNLHTLLNKLRIAL